MIDPHIIALGILGVIALGTILDRESAKKKKS